MKCPRCGYAPPRGRPKALDDARVRRLRAKGIKLAVIAAEYGVTPGAVRAALKRPLPRK